MKAKYLYASREASRITAMLLAIVAIFAASCKKDIYGEFDQGINEPVALTSDRDTIKLFEKDYDKYAVSLSWTAGSNFGSNSSIAYKLIIDKEGNNFRNAVQQDLGKAAFEKKFYVKDLNEILVNQLGLTPGVEAGVEVRVISSVSGQESLADSASKVLKITPYQPVATTLFLLGSASPGGWDANGAEPLIVNTAIPGKFTWAGQLTPGELKFIINKGSFTPSYNKGATNNQLVLRTSDNQPDDKFVITEGGSYSITVDIISLTASISKGVAPPYTQLWIVGAATPNEWNIDNAAEMRADRSNPFIFTYNGILKAGEFKFPTAKSFSSDMYMPLENHQALNLPDVRLTPGGNPDNKWTITNPGAYKIRLDITPGAEKIAITPFTPPSQIWFVGDATPKGWDIGNATLMVADATNPYVFTYTGELKAGEFKFPLQKDFNGAYYMPVTENEDATSTEMKFVPTGQPDFKWKIPPSQAGNYKITIDVLHETIVFQKL